MNLRLKIPLLMGAALVVLIAVIYITLRTILLKNITQLEERDMGRNIERVTDAINSEISRLNSTTGDYATWDDTYKFIFDRNKEYVKTNINSETMLNLKIDLISFFDLKGDIVTGGNSDSKEGAVLPLLKEQKKILEQNKIITRHNGLDSEKKGLLLMHGSPFMFASRPIIKSNFEGPIRGSVIMGKYIDSSEIAKLSTVTHIKFILSILDSAVLKKNNCPPEILTHLKKTIAFAALPIDSKTINGFKILNDVDGQPALLLMLSENRDIYKQGSRTLKYLLISLILIGLVFIITTLLILEIQVLRRLTHLNRDIQIIKSNRNMQSRITLIGSDEIAALAMEINRMLEALERSNLGIRESEKKFRLTFESSKNAILWIDADTGTIVNCNREAEKLFGKTKLDLINTIQTALFPIGKAPFDDKRYKASAEKGESYEAEVSFRTNLDERKDVIISTSVTSFSGKRLIQEVYRDITQQKQVEKERFALEEQLRQSQKMEVIGQLAGGVAHDFNNMLAGISGYSDLIRRKFASDNPVLERYAVTIFDTARNAAELTGKLLAFARKGKNEKAIINIHSVIQNVFNLLEHTMDKKIAMTRYLRAAPATVLGDGSQLENVVLNLAMNARDAMPNGGELSFATDCILIDEAYKKRHPYKLTDGRYVMLAVTDSGTGMDESVKMKLYEPFFTTKGPGKGTGLGLASVYGTIKSHNGSIECYSEVGKGTTFKIYLPVIERNSAKRRHNQDSIIRGTGRILLADDEQLVRSVTTDILTELGYNVTEVTNGLECVECYKAHPGEFDLVILDIIMPQMGGYDCFMALKAFDPDVKVLVSSGFSMNNESIRILDQGARGFISKPFDIYGLSKAISEAFKSLY